MTDPNSSESDAEEATDPHLSADGPEALCIDTSVVENGGDEDGDEDGERYSPVADEVVHEEAIEVEVGWLEDEVVQKPCPQPELPPLQNPRRPTPSPEVVRRLPRQPSSASIASSTATGADDTCCICFERYNDTNPGSAGACGHVFHFVCLLEWQQRNNTCPLCLVPMAMVAEDTRPRPAEVAGERKPKKERSERRRRRERHRQSRESSTAASFRSNSLSGSAAGAPPVVPDPAVDPSVADHEYSERRQRQREDESREDAPLPWWKRLCRCCTKK